jgi:hypothetical protein
VKTQKLPAVTKVAAGAPAINITAAHVEKAVASGAAVEKAADSSATVVNKRKVAFIHTGMYVALVLLEFWNVT